MQAFGVFFRHGVAYKVTRATGNDFGSVAAIPVDSRRRASDGLLLGDDFATGVTAKTLATMGLGWLPLILLDQRIASSEVRFHRGPARGYF
jgi:hypothetical protein